MCALLGVVDPMRGGSRSAFAAGMRLPGIWRCGNPYRSAPMARSWGELLGEPEAPAESEDERRGFFGRLRESLSKSRRALTEQLALAAFDPADDEAWERLEEAMIAADVGVRSTAELVRRLESRGQV